MITPTAGFITFGVHKGVDDPMGVPFVDEALIARSKQALKDRGVNLIEHETIIASKDESQAALREMKCNNDVDCVILFAGTWIWAAHLIAAIRDFAMTGKGLLIWTHPGSQGWRPVGGFVLQGAL